MDGTKLWKKCWTNYLDSRTVGINTDKQSKKY